MYVHILPLPQARVPSAFALGTVRAMILQFGAFRNVILPQIIFIDSPTPEKCLIQSPLSFYCILLVQLFSVTHPVLAGLAWRRPSHPPCLCDTGRPVGRCSLWPAAERTFVHMQILGKAAGTLE